MEIVFTADATPGIVQQLVRSLRFRTESSTFSDPRIVSFSLTDGDGGLSETLFKTVNVSA